MTEQNFAKHVRCSQSYMSEIISGNKQPGVELAVRIEQATSGVIRVESWPRYTVLRNLHRFNPSAGGDEDSVRENVVRGQG